MTGTAQCRTTAERRVSGAGLARRPKELSSVQCSLAAPPVLQRPRPAKVLMVLHATDAARRAGVVQKAQQEPPPIRMPGWDTAGESHVRPIAVYRVVAVFAQVMSARFIGLIPRQES